MCRTDESSRNGVAPPADVGEFDARRRPPTRRAIDSAERRATPRTRSGPYHPDRASSGADQPSPDLTRRGERRRRGDAPTARRVRARRTGAATRSRRRASTDATTSSLISACTRKRVEGVRHAIAEAAHRRARGRAARPRRRAGASCAGADRRRRAVRRGDPAVRRHDAAPRRAERAHREAAAVAGLEHPAGCEASPSGVRTKNPGRQRGLAATTR